MTSAFRSSLAALLAAASLAGMAPPALAQSGHATQPRQARAACDARQDHAACLREAAAARQAASGHSLTNASPDIYQRNALARCQFLPPTDRGDCEARVRGTGNTSTDGSVMGGGQVHETTTTMPAPSRTR